MIKNAVALLAFALTAGFVQAEPSSQRPAHPNRKPARPVVQPLPEDPAHPNRRKR